ncbi:ArsR/SmtB family transcription factor [Streptomyces catenulae]|uniref:Winged helix-turn-helix domain-containing protein n=1 Tax=Streptomyces catenulae TaxID=66875 RepID=A0ABV2Z3V6_9ACTN|nr:winged helix-turn-helix domain-containing protein [Streptomyces catenulae]
MTSEELLAVLAAVGHTQRLRIIAELSGGRLYVSELARRLGMSRPLLYMHLERLEKAGLVAGNLELSDDGKALKYFELAPFDLHVNIDTILAAVRADEAADDAAPSERAGGEAPADRRGSEDVKGKRT